MTAGNFDVYGGIYRDVRLVIRDHLSLPFQGSADQEGGTFVTTPQVSEASGAVDVCIWVRNENGEAKECSLVTTVLDAVGQKLLEFSAAQTIQPRQTFLFHLN